MTKRFFLLCLVYQEPYIIWLSFMLHLFKMIVSPGIFSFFQKIFFLVSGVKGGKMVQMTKKFLSVALQILGVIRGCKREKLVQNAKKLCLGHSIFQETYIIWLSFMVEIWKMMISPGFFFNVKILIFEVA